MLPEFMHRENTCFFTGHRTLPDDDLPEISRLAEHAVIMLHNAGYTYFVAGGALGFDTLAAQTVLRAAKFAPDIHLVLALPCRDQTENWKNAPEHIKEYQRIRAYADTVHYVNDLYFDGCMKERNRFMAENSSFCIAYYNGAVRSGAGQTFRMAVSEGIAIYNIYDALRKDIKLNSKPFQNIKEVHS